MQMRIFAAINVGSSDIELKVYQLTANKGITVLDHVKSIIELGSDTYSKGFIQYDLVNELCLVLEKFKLKMEEYQITSYVAYGTSALREAKNCQLILEHIRVRTGLKVRVISNAEQRFLILKSVAYGLDNFEALSQEGAVILDLGAGSLQISLFEAGTLIFSQNIILGSLRIREILADLEGRTSDFVRLMEDYISNEIGTFKKIGLIHNKVKHIIVVGEEFSSIINYVNTAKNKDFLTVEQFHKIYNKLLKSTPAEIAEKYGIPFETASVIIPSSIVYKNIIDDTTAQILWEPEAGLCDGIAIDYYEHIDRPIAGRRYDEDIINSVRFIAKKYESNEKHTSNVEKLALDIFDGIRKFSGLHVRHRMLLRIAVILHDCGKYINMAHGISSSYYIVKTIEIIGLSDLEKEIVGKSILFHGDDATPSYQSFENGLSQKDYTVALKLCAILSMANCMDRSHKQKINKVRVSVKGREMKLSADTIEDIALEQGVVSNKAAMFEEVFGLIPVLRQKRK